MLLSNTNCSSSGAFYSARIRLPAWALPRSAVLQCLCYKHTVGPLSIYVSHPSLWPTRWLAWLSSIVFPVLSEAVHVCCCFIFTVLYSTKYRFGSSAASPAQPLCNVAPVRSHLPNNAQAWYLLITRASHCCCVVVSTTWGQVVCSNMLPSLGL